MKVDEEYLKEALQAASASGHGWSLDHEEVEFLLEIWNRNERARRAASDMLRGGVAPVGFDALQGALYD